MAKDDFDMDFHFDDDDFDPKAFLDGEDGADIDLSEFRTTCLPAVTSWMKPSPTDTTTSWISAVWVWTRIPMRPLTSLIWTILVPQGRSPQFSGA